MSALDHLNGLNSDTLSGCLQTFIIAKQVDGLSPKTIIDYQQKLAPFISFCLEVGVSKPKAVTLNLVRLYLQRRRETVSPVSVKDAFSMVKIFLNWLAHERVIEHNPMEGEKPPRVPKRIIQPFSPANLKDLLTLCGTGTDFCSARNTAMVLVFIDSGVRLAEMAGMKISDIDIEAGTIKIFGKGSKERLVGIGKESRRALLRYIMARKSKGDILWLTQEKKQISPEGIKMIVRRLRDRAGIVGVRCSPHTFRHTFAVNMVRNGCDLVSLQNLLGHADLEMTQHYIRSFGNVDAINAYQNNSPVDRLGLK